jgi:hypothetical protein
MRNQLQHIVEVASRPNVFVQVLPDSVGAHAAMDGPFTILDFPEQGDQSLVYIETATSDLYLETREELARYRLIFDLIRSSALSPDSSMTYLAKLIERLN